MERIVKGYANHRRLEMMAIIDYAPEQTIEELAKLLKIGYQNASDHIRKLAIAGLVMKRSDGSHVRHSLTSRGKVILAFCKKLE